MGAFGDLNESEAGSSIFVSFLVRSMPIKRKRQLNGTLKSNQGDPIEYFGVKRGDSIEYQYKGVLVNKPGFVAAVGGIPDELKIKGGLRLLIPAPTFKVPADLPRDRTERRKFVSEAFRKAVPRDWYKEPLIQAYKKAKFSCNSDLHNNNDHVPLSMVELNFARPIGSVSGSASEAINQSV